MNQGQHGFRKGRSCLSQLLQQYDNLLQKLARGNNVDTVFQDFAKAFDKVDHSVLLHKLRNLGITGKMGVWIHSFLTDQSQTAVANGKYSLPSKVVSGIPQGSVLGPLLSLYSWGTLTKEWDTRWYHRLLMTQILARLYPQMGMLISYNKISMQYTPGPRTICLSTTSLNCLGVEKRTSNITSPFKPPPTQQKRPPMSSVWASIWVTTALSTTTFTKQPKRQED